MKTKDPCWMIKGILSKLKNCPHLIITTGVPQGSILGPMLFVMYVNDLANVVCNCSIIMYVDDTVLFFANPDTSVIQEKLNDNLSLMDTWLRDNCLFLNTSKTESMVFGSHARLTCLCEFNITINSCPIKHVTEFIYLGILFDECINVEISC